MNDVTDPGLELWERMEPIDGFRTEYLGGEIVMMATPNAFHNRVVELVRDALPAERFARRSTQAVAIPGLTDRPDPDLTVTGAELAEEFFTACPSEDVLLLLEVVSPGKKAIRRDYEEKAELYARGDVPLYLIVDPNNGTWLLQSDPDRDQGEYRTSHKGSFGEPIRLPAPFELSILSDRFLIYPPNA